MFIYNCYSVLNTRSIAQMKSTKTYIRQSTLISPYSILLFGGNIHIEHTSMLVKIDNFATFKVNIAPSHPNTLIHLSTHIHPSTHPHTLTHKLMHAWNTRYICVNLVRVHLNISVSVYVTLYNVYISDTNVRIMCY